MHRIQIALRRCGEIQRYDLIGHVMNLDTPFFQGINQWLSPDMR